MSQRGSSARGRCCGERDPVKTSERLNFARQRRARAYAELGVNVRQVARHRPLGEEQRGGHFSVRPAVGDERGDATLRGRQSLLARTPTDPSVLATCLLDPSTRSELLEAYERSADRVAGGALLPRASEDGAQGEQRSRSSEGIPNLLVARDCLLKERDRLPDSASGGGGEAAATRDVCQHAVPAEPRGIRLPAVDQAHRLVDSLELE